MIKVMSEGSSKYGFGHMVRCLTIIDYCKNNNIDCEFIVDGDESSDLFIQKNDGKNINWKNIDYLNEYLKADDIVVIDSYYVSLEELEFIKARVKKIIVIDDLSRLPYKDMIVLNPNFCAELVEYDNHNDLLLGSEYCLLRKEFINKKYSLINKEVKNILITFGGSDVLNLTPKIVQFINNKYDNLNLNIIIGSGYSNVDEINEVVSNYDNIKLYKAVDAKKMVELMLNNDFVISAAGQTLNELLRVGCPSCFIKVIDNQQLNIDYLNIHPDGVILKENDFSEIDKMFDSDFRIKLINKLSLIPNNVSGAEKLFDFLKQKELI